LLVRSVIKLQTADLGFNPRGLYAVDVGIQDSRQTLANATALAASRSSMVTEIAQRLEHLPHVTGVTFAAVKPGMRSFMVGALEAEGTQPPDPKTMDFIDNNAVQA